MAGCHTLINVWETLSVISKIDRGRYVLLELSATETENKSVRKKKTRRCVGVVLSMGEKMKYDP